MQKIKRKKRTYSIIIAMILAVVLASGVAFALMMNGRDSTEQDDSEIDYSEPSGEQRDAGRSAIDAAKNPGDDEQKPDHENASQEQIGMSITVANQNSGTLQVRTLIETLQAGACTLTMSKDGEEVIKNAQSQTLAHASTCQGFDVPVTELSPGEWQLEILFTAGEQQAAVSQIININ